MSINVAPPGPEVRTFIDELLSEQQDLSAVERFSRAHDAAKAELPGQRHRNLIPLSMPRPGEQYGFEVDLDRCSGCKGCVTACHALNGLDDAESWRDVGLLLGEVHVPVSSKQDAGNRVIPLQQTVTTACHHCVEPACLLGCPVLAYHKDSITGIVRHLDDQCIGCSYCILKCPYEVPRFSAKRGIVRKCDMCHGRLAEGEAPACAQACPNEAIRITTVQAKWVGIEYRQRRTTDWLPDSPEPGYTLPTTQYISKSGQPRLLAANHYRNEPAQAHWPLILMLVLTQIGMGAMTAGWLRFPQSASRPSLSHFIGWGGFVCFIIGLVASAFHLGQPRKAWRVWLGWRTSWMSREAILLNLTLGLSLLTATFVATPLRGSIGALFGRDESPAVFTVLPVVLCLSIWGALVSQAMVYVDTRRVFWSWSHTGPRFLGTFIIATAMAAEAQAPHSGFAAFAAFTLIAKVLLEVRPLKYGASDSLRRNQLQRSAQLITGPLRPIFALRLLLAGISIAFLFSGLTPSEQRWEGFIVAAIAFFAGELAERWLYFTAVSPDKMPGVS